MFVKFKSDATAEQIQTQLQDLKLRVVELPSRPNSAYKVTPNSDFSCSSLETVDSLKRLSTVEYAEPNWLIVRLEETLDFKETALGALKPIELSYAASSGPPALVWRRPKVGSARGSSFLPWERFGKELPFHNCLLSRTESTGRIFQYVLITRRCWFKSDPLNYFFKNLIHKGCCSTATLLFSEGQFVHELCTLRSCVSKNWECLSLALATMLYATSCRNCAE